MTMLYKTRPPPATNRRDAAHYCQPEALAPGDDWYVDLAEARGGGGTIASIVDRLRDVREHTYNKIIFLSHRGAGKTTELQKMRDKLAASHRTVYLDVDRELSPLRVRPEELLVIAALSVQETMEMASMPIDSHLLRNVAQWFSTVVLETEWGRTLSAEVEAGAEAAVDVFSFVKLFGKAKSLFQYESKERETVTEELRRRPGQLVDNVNLLLDAANVDLARANCGRLLIIFDNLDRYRPELMDETLIQNSVLFRELRADVILTAPVSLYYLPSSGRLSDCYDAVEFMDTVALRSRHENWRSVSGPGLALLRAAIEKRIVTKTVFEELSDVDDLILASGGSLRELFEIVALAARRSTDTVKITHAAVEQAKKKRISELRDIVNMGGYHDALAKIAVTKQIISDPSMPRLLYDRLVLKYNGDGWYDVVPLLWQDEYITKFFAKYENLGVR